MKSSGQPVPASALEIRFKNRAGFVGASVMGDQRLLDRIPMEDMDSVIISGARTQDVNANRPDITTSIVK